MERKWGTYKASARRVCNVDHECDMADGEDCAGELASKCFNIDEE